MAQTTPKLGLTKPELTDLITDTIPALAQNMQDIDDKVAPLSGGTFTGNVTVDGGSGFLEAIVKRIITSNTIEGSLNVQAAGGVRLVRRSDGNTTSALELGDASSVKVSKRGAATTLLDIAEYGSNANGEYVRFYNGLQVCWYDSETVLTTTTGTGSLYVSSAFAWTFPIGFNARPVVIPACRYGGTGAGAWGRVNATPSAGSVSLAVLGATNTSTGIPTPVAIGTWY